MYSGYGYATPPPAYPQPARSGNPLALILLGLVALAGIAVGALAATGVFSHTSAAAHTITASSIRPPSHTTPRSPTRPKAKRPSSGVVPGNSTGATTSCGGDLSVGPNTSCSFAQNVEQAYDQSSRGDTTVTAFSPATGLSYTINCTGGSPHVCTGGTTHDAAVYFTSSPTPGSTGSSTSSPPSTTSSPGNLTACDQNISAGQYTSCPFAENVFTAYAQSYQANGEQSTNTVNANSPVTHKSYNMDCTTDNVTVSCTGGNKSFVTFPMQAVENY